MYEVEILIHDFILRATSNLGSIVVSDIGDVEFVQPEYYLLFLCLHFCCGSVCKELQAGRETGYRKKGRVFSGIGGPCTIEIIGPA